MVASKFSNTSEFNLITVIFFASILWRSIGEPQRDCIICSQNSWNCKREEYICGLIIPSCRSIKVGLRLKKLKSISQHSGNWSVAAHWFSLKWGKNMDWSSVALIGVPVKWKHWLHHSSDGERKSLSSTRGWWQNPKTEKCWFYMQDMKKEG